MDPTFKGITTCRACIATLAESGLKKWTRLLRGLRPAFMSVSVKLLVEEMDPTFKGITTLLSSS